MTVADQAPFLGVVLGHWANAVLIGVPANGVKPTVTYDEVAPGGALSQALGTIAAGVLHRAKPGYLSSMVAALGLFLSWQIKPHLFVADILYIFTNLPEKRLKMLPGLRAPPHSPTSLLRGMGLCFT